MQEETWEVLIPYNAWISINAKACIYSMLQYGKTLHVGLGLEDYKVRKYD